MTVQRQEEIAHAMKFFDFVIERGGKALLVPVAGPDVEWKSPPAGFEAADKLAGSEHAGDILRSAIEMEKDSIVFYLTVKKMVPGDGGKGRIDDIIEQEMGHVALLSKQLADAG